MISGDSQGQCKNCGAVLPPYPGKGPRREYCNSSGCNAQGRVKRINYQITKISHSWSKWGGSRHMVVKENLDKWSCQACGGEQTNDLPGYRFPIPDTKEFMRICSKCQFEVNLKKIIRLIDLINLVRCPKNFESYL